MSTECSCIILDERNTVTAVTEQNLYTCRAYVIMNIFNRETEGRIEMRLTNRKNVFIKHLGVLTHAREASNVVVGSQTTDQTADLGTLRTYDGAIVGAP